MGDEQEMVGLNAVADQCGMEVAVSAVEKAIVRSIAKGDTSGTDRGEWWDTSDTRCGGVMGHDLTLAVCVRRHPCC